MPDRPRYLRRRRTFEPERKCLVGDVFEGHVVGDDVVVQMFVGQRLRDSGPVSRRKWSSKQNTYASARMRPCALRKESVDSVARLHLLHVIGGHGVEQARAVFAGHPNPAAARKIEQRRGIHESFVAGSRHR
jgi:hypothetical protein